MFLVNIIIFIITIFLNINKKKFEYYRRLQAV